MIDRHRDRERQSSRGGTVVLAAQIFLTVAAGLGFGALVIELRDSDALPRDAAAFVGPLAQRRIDGVIWPEFQSTDHRGQALSNAALRGTVWIADFLSLQCGSCSTTTSRIADVMERSPGKSLRFVSFSIDKDAEPLALGRYQNKYRRVDSTRWNIVRRDEVHTPIMLVALGLARDEASARRGVCSMEPRFYLVDRRGRLRGIYDSSSSEQMEWLVSDADSLEHESP